MHSRYLPSVSDSSGIGSFGSGFCSPSYAHFAVESAVTVTVTVSLLEIAVKDRIARQSDTIQITKSHCEIFKK